MLTKACIRHCSFPSSLSPSEFVGGTAHYLGVGIGTTHVRHHNALRFLVLHPVSACLSSAKAANAQGTLDRTRSLRQNPDGTTGKKKEVIQFFHSVVSAFSLSHVGPGRGSLAHFADPHRSFPITTPLIEVICPLFYCSSALLQLHFFISSS